jgi:hypothetical protein
MLVQSIRPEEELSDNGLEVERRAVVRYLCDREITYSPVMSRERFWARVRNISSHGIGLLLGTPLEPGTDMVIDMKTMDPRISLSLVARVVHSTMQEEGNWLVGCKFLTRPTEEQVLALL